jgi:hypothetical protein
MTTFLTTAQREFLIEEYKEQLIEFDQEDQVEELTAWLRTLDNVDFLQECVEQMPIYGEPTGRRILANVKAGKEVTQSDYFS